MATAPTTIDEAIGELLRLADEAQDNISKKIISAYKKDVAHQTNITNMSSSKYRLSELETCAEFLKIPLINDTCGKKLFPNKAALSDRLIIKIESLFPQKCQECESDYCSSLANADETLFECFLCTQLSHNCELIRNKHAKLAEITLQNGMTWLCEGCHRKNNYYGKKVIINLNNNPNSTNGLTTSGENKNGQEGSPIITNSDEVVDLTKQTEICQNYKHGKCQYGINGNKLVDGLKCKFKHPKRCIRFCRFGNSHQAGCAYGTSCRWFHPILCRFSVRYGNCSNDKCTYVHLANTSRKNPSYYETQNRNHSKSKLPSRNWGNNNYYRNPNPQTSAQQNQSEEGYSNYNYQQDFPRPVWGKEPSQTYTRRQQNVHFLDLIDEFKTMAASVRKIQEEWKEMKNQTAQAPPVKLYPPTLQQWHQTSPVQIPTQISQESSQWYPQQ